MKEEDIVNKNMEWRKCDCWLNVGSCLCEIETEKTDNEI